MKTFTTDHRPIGAGLLICGLFTICAPVSPAAAQPDPEEILRRIDSNIMIDSARITARMSVQYSNGQIRTMEFISWSQGTDRSFLEFTSPARDAGSRFLRIGGDRMWIFLPRVGKSVLIQGHRLRQGLMGSDFSFGDASENPSMVEDYSAVVEGEEVFNDRPTYVLHLEAKRDDLAYPSRRIWVDSQYWLPLKEERYARSGKLLKTMVLSDIRRVGERWYSFRMELNNALQADTSTVLEILEMEIDIPIPSSMFTMRNLEGGEQ